MNFSSFVNKASAHKVSAHKVSAHKVSAYKTSAYKVLANQASFLSGALVLAVLSGCGGGSSSSSGGGNSSNGGITRTNSITFVSTRDGNAEIYVMKPDGTAQTRLTNSPGTDGTPNKSRDGSRIVFESNRDGNSEIYIMNFDGSGVQRLTNDAGDFAPVDTQPVFSPDGGTIAWTSTRDHADGGTDIWLMNADGSNQRRFVTSAAGQGSITPAFSPDGTRLAYFAIGPRAQNRTEILTFKNFATGTVTSTSLNVSSPDHLRFNPAGTKVIYEDQFAFSSFGRIRIFDIASQTATDGPVAAPLDTPGTNALNVNPDYSPDGNSVVWDSPSGSGNGPTGPIGAGQIYVAKLDGSNPVAITSVGVNSSPDW